MRGCNDTVTIWNRWRNQETGKDVFYRHVIPVQCKFKNTVRSATTKGIVGIATSAMVIIPMSEMYRPEAVWAGLPEAGRAEYFTVQKGDTVALGAHDAEITGEKPYTETEIKTALGPDSFTVKAYQDNTRSARGRHIKVEGV